MSEKVVKRRFVQTFWSKGKSLLEHCYGWGDAETHLMSWTLSSNTLKGNSDEVVLYTDSEGARVLVDKLHLPYDDVFVCYDKLECPHEHWAIPKMLTYAKQNRPFIHVDGDVFLPKGLSESNWNSNVLVQNIEDGTSYYKSMMDFILSKKPVFPNYVKKELSKVNIGSYNAGILGGTDITFIHKYCEEAFRIIFDNEWFSPDCKSVNVNQNLLFEQLLLYAYAMKEGREIKVLLSNIFKDNQYTFANICNFFRYKDVPIIHMLGGYKRNSYVCDLMQNTLLKYYPKEYERVLRMFPERNNHLCGNYGRLSPQKLDCSKFIEKYESFINLKLKNWAGLSANELLEEERQFAEIQLEFDQIRHDCDNLVIKRASNVEIYHFDTDCPQEAYDMICHNINKNKYNKYLDIAIRPSFRDKGYVQALINDLQYNILKIIEKSECSFAYIENALRPFFRIGACEDNTIKDLILNELRQLVNLRLVFIYTNHRNIV